MEFVRKNSTIILVVLVVAVGFMFYKQYSSKLITKKTATSTQGTDEANFDGKLKTSPIV